VTLKSFASQVSQVACAGSGGGGGAGRGETGEGDGKGGGDGDVPTAQRSEAAHENAATRDGETDAGWKSAYYLVDAWEGGGEVAGGGSGGGGGARGGGVDGSGGQSMEITLLVALVNRPARASHGASADTVDDVYSGKTVCKLQHLRLARTLATGDALQGGAQGGGQLSSWRLVHSAGVGVGGMVPPLARLWPSRDSVLLASPHSYDREVSSFELVPLRVPVLL
jgi:hypothetical protein